MLWTILSCVLLLAESVYVAEAGTCFQHRDERRRCRGVLNPNPISREDCCRTRGFYVDREMESGELFLDMMLRQQGTDNCVAACQGDPSPCEGIGCRDDEVCRVEEDGEPVCACDIRCSAADRSSGPVCTTEKLKYTNRCRMREERCRRRANFDEARCPQTGCAGVVCGPGKTCVTNEEGRVECRTRLRRISCFDKTQQPVCGVDNVTYTSPCHLAYAEQIAQKAIHVAYVGSCEGSATCQTIRCPEEGMTCYPHHTTGQPVCMRCHPLPSHCNDPDMPLVCATTGETISNTCVLRVFSCLQQEFVGLASVGACLDKRSA